MSAWSLYDELIDAMPSGITVHDYCLGAHWTYIVADCGMGLAKTVRGGGKADSSKVPSTSTLKRLQHWLNHGTGSKRALGSRRLMPIMRPPMPLSPLVAQSTRTLRKAAT